MFYSSDLLCVRGGKFGTIWLLATTKDRQAVFKKKKSELMKMNVTKLCQELVNMFPVQGKNKSFSLRTSSILMYGTCIHLRLMSEDLRRSVLLLLGRHKTPSGGQGGGIDLPGGQMSSHLARLAVPTEADLAMGNIQWPEVDDVFGDVDFRAREADITMREFNQARLEYEGLELPLLSTRDILTESWSLVDEGLHGGLAVGASQDGAQPRRGILPDIFVLPSSKRARLEVEDPFDQEHTVMETVEQLGGGDLPTEETFMEQSEGDQATAAPVRSRMPTVPTIEVT
eukprot:GFUD01009414.1.p1 GENE.GFUD01009414.1~~GFUD01009414.1.p1  ORF type:complete len:285 (-),score=97.64 GFUD01009414.1:82-936(-)